MFLKGIRNAVQLGMSKKHDRDPYININSNGRMLINVGGGVARTERMRQKQYPKRFFDNSIVHYRVRMYVQMYTKTNFISIRRMPRKRPVCITNINSMHSKLASYVCRRVICGLSKFKVQETTDTGWEFHKKATQEFSKLLMHKLLVLKQLPKMAKMLTLMMELELRNIFAKHLKVQMKMAIDGLSTPVPFHPVQLFCFDLQVDNVTL